MLSRLARPRTQGQFHNLPVSPNLLLSPRSTPRRFTSTAARRPTDDKTQTTQLSPTIQSRSVATAASTSEPSIQYDQSYATVPTTRAFLHGSQATSSSTENRPIIIHQDLTSPAPRLGNVRGVGGDPYDLFPNFMASLRVRRMERAEEILARLREVYNSTASELAQAHNTFLAAYLQMVLRENPDYNPSKMFKWAMMNMHDKEIPMNLKTFVLLSKAFLAKEEGLKLTRYLRRLFSMVKDSRDVDLETIRNPELFTEAEYAKLQEHLPEYFRPLSQDRLEAGTGQLLKIPESTAHRTSNSNASTLPKLRPVKQKGAGLVTVKRSLSIFLSPEEILKDIPYPDDFEDLTEEQKEQLWNRQRQIRLEEDGVDAAVGRWRIENENMQKLGITSALSTKPMEALMWQWYTALIPSMQEEIRLSKEAMNSEDSEDKDRLGYGMYLDAFSAERLAAMTLLVLLPMFGGKNASDGIKVASACMEVGRHLASEYGISTSEILSPEFSAFQAPQSPESQETSGDDPDLTESTYEALGEIKSFEWSSGLKAKIGAMLLSKVLETAKVQVDRIDPESGKQYAVNEPALFHQSAFKKGRKTGMLKLHPVVQDKLKREPIRGTIGTKYPMIVEPLPWTGFKKGGFYRYPESIIKTTSGEDQRLYCLAAVQRGDMKDVLHGLTVLGKTAWRVNQDVFRVVIEVWNSGEELASIAPENPQIEYPPEPGPDATKRQMVEYMAAKKKINNLKSAYHSQRCFQNFQLEVAHAFKDEVFYFPHNMDFRGRAYPLPALLNHMGADMARGLLMFAKGKELGAVGLSWLKIHLANVYGFDKASLNDREEFAMTHLNDVYDSAEKPLSGRRWWLKAEDPWQCLATCFELKHAFDSPDPTRYVSHLPVHQDGTCNGLQHYAALGGDKAGAAQVNLQPGDKPSDIYTAVADMVRADVVEDAANGVLQALAVKEKITRKVVKQTVMTNVYGVTFVGARDQVQRRLEDLMTDEELAQGGGRMKLSSYVARLIFRALGRMFNGAQAIQEWLGVCAHRISSSLSSEQVQYIESRLVEHKPANSMTSRSRFKIPGTRKSKHGQSSPPTEKRDWVDMTSIQNVKLQFRSPVIWTTPLKMPVVQPYRNTKSKQVATKLQNISLKNPDTIDAVDKRKQLQAFPPNFIHSLDASHMFLSAIKCNEVGLTFSSVHDSFWTHAADVPLMNRILRDAFVSMHSEDIIGRLHEEFTVRYKGSMYLESISGSSPVAQQIRDWRRKNKIGTLAELCMERNRWKLLNSDKEEDRQKGREMVTPGAMYAKALAEHPELLKSAVEEGLTKLGQEEVKGDSSGFAVDPTRVDDVVDEGDNDMDLPGEMDITREAELTKAKAAAVAGTATAAEPAATEDGDASNKESIAKAPEAARKARGSRETVRKLWVPMSFPEVPAKGEFDVRVLRDSQYFFS
ncbi:mitochondrial DNA-directed RNA polymerase [Phyllosticta citriasiana]|uniref:DNA-directed RNA polymerase n=1 Tax=Phyllosticta citriasiana TaxID=595635 RepID=A0ABR1KD96_9PEZI